MPLRVIPVLDLKAGRAVRAIGGDRDHYQPLRTRVARGFRAAWRRPRLSRHPRAPRGLRRRSRRHCRAGRRAVLSTEPSRAGL